MDGWALLAAAGGSRNLSIFDPASPDTLSIQNLAILTCAIFALIFLIVEGVLFYCIWRFRGRPSDAAGEPAQVYGSQPIEVAWTAAPTMIVFFLVLVTARTLWQVNAADPDAQASLQAAAEGDKGSLRVTVVGRQWWFEYIYESYGGRKLTFTTANELHIPAGSSDTPRRAYLTLKSADVCHSYWVPRLAGKVDLIPGRTNMLVLETTEPGLYAGQCAEYCGTQHANMLIRVVVDTPANFDRWLENQKADAVDDPAVEEGKRIFLSQSCINCHRVRGTVAKGSYAPDLTHLMSRETLASCEIENTPENLDRWINDPQQLKPGCLMPAFGLEKRQRELVGKYLTTLR